MEKENIAVVGYSGHAYVVLDACKKSGLNITAYCDYSVNNSHNKYNLKYIGNEADINFDWNLIDSFVLGIGDNIIRKKVANLLINNSKKILSVIHPTATINDFVTIGNGTFVASNVTINPLVEIGNYCIINTGAIIEHECRIENSVHIAPGAVLTGNVEVKENSFIGANSVVKQGVVVGKNVVIGAGSVVIKDVPDGEIWAGNPAKKIK